MAGRGGLRGGVPLDRGYWRTHRLCSISASAAAGVAVLRADRWRRCRAAHYQPSRLRGSRCAGGMVRISSSIDSWRNHRLASRCSQARVSSVSDLGRDLVPGRDWRLCPGVRDSNARDWRRTRLALRAGVAPRPRCVSPSDPLWRRRGRRLPLRPRHAGCQYRQHDRSPGLDSP